jgi:ribosomal-protein-alanine N-acetyltransferase
MMRRFLLSSVGRINHKNTFAIEYKNELVGVIGFIPQDDIYRKNAELGYWLGEPYWNKGIMTQAITLAVDYAFTELNIVRIFAHVFDRNIPSQKVLAKAGFNLDYIAKKAVIKKWDHTG